jgi:hypothetical protein
VVIATAISGSGPYTATLSEPIRMPNWGATGKFPQAWWGSATVTNSGVEDMSIDGTTSGSKNITIATAYQCWVKNVRSIMANQYHVFNYITAHNIVRNSYFYYTTNAAQQSYGVGGGVNSGLLIENNIMQGIADPVNFDASCSGCVVGYNFALNQYYSVSMPYMFGMISFHAAGEDMILIEANSGSQSDSDVIHGAHSMNTLFRNYFNGFEPNSGTVTSVNTDAMHVGAFSRYYNVIGNVLGTSGYHTAYQCLAPDATTSPCATQFKGVYDIGYSSNTHGQIDYNSNTPDDPLAGSTLMRWGNYDTVNNAVRFVSSEIPSGISGYPNPVPSSQTLPASFYLSAKPAWWPSGKPWPAIGPDVTGGNISYGAGAAANLGGHVYTIPAQDCYTNTMGGPANGTGSVLSFDPNSCYAPNTGTAPMPPSSLNATVQ